MCQRPGEQHLRAAVGDLPVREVAALGDAAHSLQPKAVEVEAQVKQERQQLGVAPVGEDQVGVVDAQQRAQVGQQGARRVEG